MEKYVIILFGATGDLARKKIIPALIRLYNDNKIKNFPILCVGRRQISKEEYFKLIKIKAPKGFVNQIHYHALDFEKPTKDFVDYANKVDRKHNCKGNRLFYLSIAPNLFSDAINYINKSDLTKTKGKIKVAIEKPFGENLESARKLHRIVSKGFKEEQIYRIDHYLGKEMVENILVFRFANQIFENIWNNKFIDHVLITLSESVGIEDRGEFYEANGVINDVVQNHILQMLALTSMEASMKYDSEKIRDCKVELLKKLKNPEKIVVGQYKDGVIDGKKVIGYRKEKKVAKDSKTDTFVSFKTFIDNKRWKGVPFFIRAGKRLSEKYSEVNLVMKDIVCNLFCNERKIEGPNVINIRIDHESGMAIRFNAKAPSGELTPVAMEFSHNYDFGANTPEAYETLIGEMIKGNQSLFTRWDEVEESWKFTDKLKKKAKKCKLEFYNAGKEPKTGIDWIHIERKLSGK